MAEARTISTLLRSKPTKVKWEIADYAKCRYIHKLFHRNKFDEMSKEILRYPGATFSIDYYYYLEDVMPESAINIMFLTMDEYSARLVGLYADLRYKRILREGRRKLRLSTATMSDEEMWEHLEYKDFYSASEKANKLRRVSIKKFMI